MKKILIGVVILFFIAHQFDKGLFGSTADTNTNQNNTYSPEGNNCALIKTDKPYSYPISVCRDKYPSESAWKDAIKRISKAKKYDEHGHRYDVTITYK